MKGNVAYGFFVGLGFLLAMMVWGVLSMVTGKGLGAVRG